MGMLSFSSNLAFPFCTLAALSDVHVDTSLQYGGPTLPSQLLHSLKEINSVSSIAVGGSFYIPDFPADYKHSMKSAYCLVVMR